MTDERKRYFGLNRRRVLQGMGAVGVASLAGCTGGGDGGDGGASSTTTTTSSNGGGGETTTEQTTTQAMSGGTLHAAQAKSPIEFDPIVLNDVPSAEISAQVFDPLYNYDSGTNFVPVIADGDPQISSDGKTWTIALKDAAKFQNGDPVTATDVKYTFEAPVKEQTENASEVDMIDHVEVVDDKTAKFHLKYPYGPFMTTLTASIVPKSVREADKKKFNKQQPVGAGPFKFTGWSEGQSATVERWDGYWGDTMPNLEKVVFHPIKEPTTRLTALKTGDEDIIKGVPPKLWQQIQSMGDASITAVPGINYFYLAFNCNEGPTADSTVREAIDYTFSMDQAIKNFVEPTGVRQYSPVPRAIAESWDMPLDQWKQIPHDKNIDKAKSMLDDSDKVPNDWNATIIVPPDDKREQIGLTVANGLKEAGYKANVRRLDWGAFLDKYNTGKASDYNMFTLGWAGSPDPDAFLYYLFFNKLANAKNGTNGSYYTNDQVSTWIDNARKSSDRNERQSLYVKATTKILNDRAHLPAYGLKNSFGVKDYVKEFKAHPVIQYPLSTSFQNVSVNQ